MRRNLSYEQLKINLLVARSGNSPAFHVDTFDLYVARRRESFVKQAASELELKEEIVKRDLAHVFAKLEELLDAQIRAAEKPKKTSAITISPEDRAEAVPDDCVILTLGCGKYRFNKLEFGDIGGIPRLLDVGQCNDAYSAIRIAMALADAFECGVNDLPLSMVLSWYEQKAVAILLTLLHLGVAGIRLGPTLPAFITPNVLDVLVKNFDLKPITTPDEDLAAILA